VTLYNVIIPENNTEITMYAVTYIYRTICIWIVFEKKNNVKMRDERYYPDTLHKLNINNVITYIIEKHIS